MKDIRRAYRAALVVLWVSVSFATTVKAQAPVIFADEEACPADLIDVPLDLIPYLNRDPAQLPINLEADSIDIPSADKLELRGGAFATQGARAIYANEILFDKKTMSLEAKKAILFSEQGDRITAVALDLDMETRIGTASDVTLQLSRRDPIPKRKIEDFSALSFDQSGYTMAIAGTSGSIKGPSATGYSSGTIRLSSGEILAINSDESEITDEANIEPISVKAKARATASRLFLEGHDRERLEDVVYSRCVAGDDAVLIEASEITLDHASGIGVGENLKVRFYGVPIAYAPRLSFPITEERK
ncbi:MAG: LPS-assembly protein LptD, partial [Proteobacteria bacterium]|nr:LPS-assembly protein LptD [Pseudomonadota bacterium]